MMSWLLGSNISVINPRASHLSPYSAMKRWTFVPTSMNLIRLWRPAGVSDPHSGFSFGPLRPPLGCESAEGSRGARRVLREPINPLCSPPEQRYGQQSHTSCRLSHRRLQLLRTTPCGPRRWSEPFPCRALLKGRMERWGDKLVSVTRPLGFTCHFPLKESGKWCIITAWSSRVTVRILQNWRHVQGCFFVSFCSDVIAFSSFSERLLLYEYTVNAKDAGPSNELMLKYSVLDVRHETFSSLIMVKHNKNDDTLELKIIRIIVVVSNQFPSRSLPHPISSKTESYTWWQIVKRRDSKQDVTSASPALQSRRHATNHQPVWVAVLFVQRTYFSSSTLSDNLGQTQRQFALQLLITRYYAVIIPAHFIS